MKFLRQHVRFLFLLTAILVPWLLCLCDCTFGPLVTDSSVFRYMGWRFATGTGGYARAWDCKGPVLVLFNAVGYWLGISPSVVFAAVVAVVSLIFWSGGYREMWDATIGYNLLERCAGVRQSYFGYWANCLFREKWFLISAASFFA